MLFIKTNQLLGGTKVPGRRSRLGSNCILPRAYVDVKSSVFIRCAKELRVALLGNDYPTRMIEIRIISGDFTTDRILIKENLAFNLIG
jgi:hypothetical protein